MRSLSIMTGERATIVGNYTGTPSVPRFPQGTYIMTEDGDLPVEEPSRGAYSDQRHGLCRTSGNQTICPICFLIGTRP